MTDKGVEEAKSLQETLNKLDIEAVYVDTGLEFPEIRNFVKTKFYKK